MRQSRLSRLWRALCNSSSATANEIPLCHFKIQISLEKYSHAYFTSATIIMLILSHSLTHYTWMVVYNCTVYNTVALVTTRRERQFLFYKVKFIFSFLLCVWFFNRLLPSRMRMSGREWVRIFTFLFVGANLTVKMRQVGNEVKYSQSVDSK